MIKNHHLTKLLLISTMVFSGPLTAGDDLSAHQALHYTSAQRLKEQKGLGRNALDSAVVQAKDSLNGFIDDAKQVWPYIRDRKLDQVMPTIMTHALNAALAEYVGEGFFELLNAKPGSLNPNVLAKILTQFQMKIADSLYDLSHKTSDYVKIGGQKHFVIKGGSFFKIIAEKAGLQHIPFGGGLLALMDTPIVKNRLQNKFNDLLINVFDSLLQYYHKPALNELVGDAAWNIIKQGGYHIQHSPDHAKSLYAMAAADYEFLGYDANALVGNEDVYGPLWSYLEPLLVSSVRQIALVSLEKAGGMALNATRDALKRKAKPGLFSLGTIGFGAASVLGFGPFGLVTTAALGVGAWKAGDLYIDCLFEEGKESLNESTQHYLYSWLPLKKSEHLRYGLNPAPSSLEKLIFAADYEERDQKLSKTLVGSFIKQILISSGAESIIESLSEGLSNAGLWTKGKFDNLVNLFQSDPDKTVEQAYEELGLSEETTVNRKALTDQGYRQYVYLKHKKNRTAEEQKILDDIARYPSWETRQAELRTLQHRMTISYGSASQVADYTKEAADNISSAQKKEQKELKAIHDGSYSVAMLFYVSPHSFSQDLILQEALERAVLNRSFDDQTLIGRISDVWMKDYGDRYLERFTDPAQADDFLLTLINNYGAEVVLKDKFIEFRGTIDTLKQHSIFRGYSDYTLLGLLENKKEVLKEAGLLDGRFQRLMLEKQTFLDDTFEHLENGILEDLSLKYTDKILQTLYSTPHNLEKTIQEAKEGYRDFSIKDIEDDIKAIKEQNEFFAGFFADTQEAITEKDNDQVDVIFDPLNPEDLGSEFELVESEEGKETRIRNTFVANKLFISIYQSQSFKQLLSAESDGLKNAVYNRLLTDFMGLVQGYEEAGRFFEDRMDDFSQIKEIFVTHNISDKSLSREESVLKAHIIHSFNRWNAEGNLTFNQFLEKKNDFMETFKTNFLQRTIYNPLLEKLEL